MERGNHGVSEVESWPLRLERGGGHLSHMLVREGRISAIIKKGQKIWVKRSWLGSKIGEKRGFYGGVWA